MTKLLQYVDPRKVSLIPLGIVLSFVMMIYASRQWIVDRIFTDTQGVPISQVSQILCPHCPEGVGEWVADHTFECTHCKRVWKQKTNRNSYNVVGNLTPGSRESKVTSNSGE